LSLLQADDVILRFLHPGQSFKDEAAICHSMLHCACKCA